MYEIFMRDGNLRRMGQITDFKKLDIIPRFNAVGTFALDVPTSSAAARKLINDRAGIIVKKDGNAIFSGMVKNPIRIFDSSGDVMTFAGEDDNAFIASRLAYPEINGNFAQKDYDVRTGSAESVMKQFVNVNASTSALPERRILTIEADKGLGGIVTASARFDNLLDLLTSIAIKGGGLGFRVVQVDDELQFQIYEPSDKTQSAFFSPLMGNLSSFSYSNEAPKSNFAIVGGGGEGTARVLISKSDNDSIAKYGRVESFVDQRNTSDQTELNQSLDEELTNKSEKNSFSFKPIDTPALQFNRDYGLGDMVSIVLTQPNEIVEQEAVYQFISAYQKVEILPERIRMIQEKLVVIQDIVREVQISITPDGDSVAPTVGNQDTNANSIIGIFNKMKALTNRISHLERR